MLEKWRLGNSSKLVHWVALLIGGGVVAYYVLPYVMLPIMLVGGGWLTSETKEVTRVTSPDQIVDAVETRTDAGVLDSRAYDVYIVPRGSKHFDKPILAGYGLDDSKMRWAGLGLPQITYTHACIGIFSNHWIDPDLEHGPDDVYDVEIRLLPPSGNALHHCD
jgi:hypothetical protein